MAHMPADPTNADLYREIHAMRKQLDRMELVVGGEHGRELGKPSLSDRVDELEAASGLKAKVIQAVAIVIVAAVGGAASLGVQAMAGAGTASTARP